MKGKKTIKNKKKILGVFLVFIFLFSSFLTAPAAKAQTFADFGPGGGLGSYTVGKYIGNKALGAIGDAFQWLLEKALMIVGGLMALVGELFDYALNISSFTDSPTIRAGWEISRDIVNLSLILILLVIAFATTLKIDNYSMKSLLPKLIGVALLVNFSLVGCGLVIDFTQLIAGFFIEKAGGSFSVELMRGIELQKAIQMNEEGVREIATNPDPSGKVIVSLIGSIIVILIATLALFLGALLMIFRVAALWILLILVPLALMAMILPATRGSWNSWVNQFLKWSFFAPLYAFFVYLALLTAQKGLVTQYITSTGTGSKDGQQATVAGLNGFSNIDLILNYAVVIGFVVGGLIVAQKMGIKGSNFTMRTAKGFGEKAKKIGKRTSMAPVKWAGRTAATSGAMKKLTESASESRFGKKISKPLQQFTEKERKAMAESEKKFDDFTDENVVRRFRAGNPREKAAAAKILAKRKKTNLLNRKGEMDKAMKLARRYNVQGDLEKARLDLAADVDKTIAGLKLNDTEKIQSEKITPEIARKFTAQFEAGGNFKSKFLEKIGETNPALIDKLESGLKERWTALRPEIKKYFMGPGGQALWNVAPSERETSEGPTTTTNRITKHGKIQSEKIRPA